MYRVVRVVVPVLALLVIAGATPAGHLVALDPVAAQQAATLTLTPTSGPVGTTITARLTGVPNCDTFFGVGWNFGGGGSFTVTDRRALTARGVVTEGMVPREYLVYAACNGPGVGVEVDAPFTVTAPTTTSASTTSTVRSTTIPTTQATIVPSTTVAPPPTTVPDEETGGPATLLAVVAVLLVLLAATVLALRRSRGRPPPTPPPPPVRNFEQLVDELLGDRPAAQLVAAGPACARVAEACGSDAVANPLIATLVWEAFVAQDRFGDVLRQAGASARALEGEMIVVRHAGETRHDLVVLDPGLSPGEVVAAPLVLDREAMAVAASGEARAWRPLVLSAEGAPWRLLDDATVVAAIAEAARVATFGVVVAAPPGRVFTQVPSPAWPVSVDDQEEEVSTVGVVALARNGSAAVTTALHSVRGHATVFVGGRRGRLLSAHEPTDSCVIAVDGPVLGEHRLGRNGPLRAVSPRQYEQVVFEGLGSGHKTTTVTAWDLSILTVQQFVGSKVYTGPETVPGDSGCALVDSEHHIIGFAVYRSAFGEAIEYSAWVWADQVFGAHELRMPD